MLYAFFLDEVILIATSHWNEAQRQQENHGTISTELTIGAGDSDSYSPSFSELLVRDGPLPPPLPDFFFDLDVLGPLAALAALASQIAVTPISAKTCLHTA